MPDEEDQSDVRRCWTATCHDAVDGSGDLIVDLPADFIIEAGLSVGDEINIEIVGQIIILRQLKSPSA